MGVQNKNMNIYVRASRRSDSQNYRCASLRIAMFNVSSMTDRSQNSVTAVRGVVLMHAAYKIVHVQDSTWRGSNSKNISNGYKLIDYGETNNRNGVGVILSEDLSGDWQVSLG